MVKKALDQQKNIVLSEPSKKSSDLLVINPSDLTECLLTCLNKREQDVLKRRYALEVGKKETLEAVGRTYQITRERVRQIERASLNKIKRLMQYKKVLQSLIQAIEQSLEKFGGLIAHHHLKEELLQKCQLDSLKENLPKQRSRLAFLLEEFASDFFHFHKKDDLYHQGWSKHKDHFRPLKEGLQQLETFLGKQAKPLSHQQIAQNLAEPIDSIYSYLQFSKNISQDPFGLWGLSCWTAVRPRRMADRIYVVLKKYAEPLHYRDISLFIEKHYNRKIHPPTVHNELIADERFVLVGRGIYALKEWGYVSGTVKEVVEKILAESQKPLTREEIVERVRQQRIVSRSTVLLALNNNSNVKKIGKDRYRYSLLVRP